MKQIVISACRKGDYHTESFWDPLHLCSFQSYISRGEKARRKTKRKRELQDAFWNSM